MTDRSCSKGLCVLLGAGAGDADMLTLAGQRWLTRGEVIVYDRLVSQDILAMTQDDAELIYVGKQPDRHPVPQNEINRILVEKTRAGKIVIRLKGGDAFIFGRGGEEADALYEAGCDFRVVPGMTAALVAGAYAGISLTDRRCASSVAFVTGHENPEKGQPDIDYKSLAGVDTLVFYMGVGRISEITAELIKAGRDANQQAAVVRLAGRANQQTVRATLGEIAQQVKENNITPPAILIVGEVTAMADRLGWYEKLPLKNKRIIVTRSRSQASKLSQQLTEFGADVLELPTIEIQPPENWSQVDEAINTIDEAELLVFTSPNGVEYFMGRLFELGYDARKIAGLKIAVIGTATGEKLREFGLQYDIIPPSYTSESLGDTIIKEKNSGKKVILARSDIAPPELAENLQAAKWEVTDITAYRTAQPEIIPENAKKALLDGDFDWITFTSASTAENLQKIFISSELTTVIESINKRKVAAIGPITADAAKKMGLRVDVVCQTHLITALVDEIVGYSRNK